MYYVPVDELVGGSLLGAASVTLPGYASAQRVVVPIAGATVFVYQRGTTTQVPVYEAQHGPPGAVAAQPLTTDIDGHVVDSGGVRVFVGQPVEIDVAVSGGGLPAPKTIPVGQAPDTATVQSIASVVRNVTGSTALAVDPAGKGFKDTATGNVTYTAPTGAVAGTVCRVEVEFIQDATGGRTVTWWAGIVWMPGIAPTMPTTANTAKLVRFLSLDGGSTWVGSYDAVVIGSDGRIGGPGAAALEPQAGLTTMVFFGSTASTARPTGFDHVIWVGSVSPTNLSAAADIWINTA